LVTGGALVGQGEATQLAVVQQIDPMYVNFTQSTTDVLKLRRALAAGKLTSAGAGQAKVTLPADLTITGDVGIGQIPTGFGIEVDLSIKGPGMDQAQLQELVDKAHIVCPYSNATRNNIDVRLHVST